MLHMILVSDNGELQKYPHLAAPSFYFRNVATIQRFILLYFPSSGCVGVSISVCVSMHACVYVCVSVF